MTASTVALATLPRNTWYSDVPRSTRGPTVAGIAIVAVSVLGFGIWSNTAMIAGAVVANGAFVATGQNKIIQHLEGGVIRDIPVREGDIVEAGQVLMLLDETGPKAELERLVLRHARAVAMEARLAAEMRQDTQVSFPHDLSAMNGDATFQSIINAQLLTFEARRNSLRTDIAALEDGIKALQERINAGQSQIEAIETQRQLIAEEIQGKTELVPRGLIRKPEILALQRAQANLRGEISRINGDIGDSRERIARTREQIVGARSTAIKEAVEQLHQVRGDIADLRERIRAQQGVLERISITAPVRGIVVKLRYHTSGGVIEPGKNIMEIVPLQDDLVIEVRVRPQDIDHVKAGEDAAIRLTALNRRVTPMLSGKVAYVSADALPEDFQTSASRDSFVVRVRLDAEQPATANRFTPKPGMPAEVYIKTAERTFFEYLMQPVRDSMSRAFRES